MKRIKNMFLLASLALMAGCSADQMEGKHEAPLYELTTPLDIETASMDGATVTRNFIPLTQGAQMGIFLSGTGYQAINNRKYELGTTGWGPAQGADTIYLGMGNANVCVYYPYTTTAKTATQIKLQSQTYSADKDLCFATNQTVNAVTKGLSFQMSHAYARLKIKITRDGSYVGNTSSNILGDCKVTSLKLTNTTWQENLNITNGVYEKRNSGGGITADTKGITIQGVGTKEYNDYLLIPCEPQNGGMKITLIVDGKTMSTTVPAASYKPEKGVYKVITLTIKGKVLTFDKVTVEDWGTPGSGGTYDPD